MNGEGEIVSREEIDFSSMIGSAAHDMKNSLVLLLHCLEGFIESNPPPWNVEGA